VYAGETKLKSQMRYKRWQMKGHVAYRGFQEPMNHHMAGGVEPLGVAALLTPADGAGDGPDPIVAAPLSVFFIVSSEAFFFVATSLMAFFFIAASSAAFFFATASSATFFFSTTSSTATFAVAASAASFTTAALVAAAVPSTAELPLDPLGLSVGAGGRGPSAVDCPGHVPSSTSAAEHHHRMILRCHCG
jgi:hypothetical protein